MQIVIEIPDMIYERFGKEYRENFISKYTTDIILDAFCEGTILPKGHGRLADMDEAIKCIEEVNGEDAIWAIGLINWACSKRVVLDADNVESEE